MYKTLSLRNIYRLGYKNDQWVENNYGGKSSSKGDDSRSETWSYPTSKRIFIQPVAEGDGGSCEGHSPEADVG